VGRPGLIQEPGYSFVLFAFVAFSSPVFTFLLWRAARYGLELKQIFHRENIFVLFCSKNRLQYVLLLFIFISGKSYTCVFKARLFRGFF